MFSIIVRRTVAAIVTVLVMMAIAACDGEYPFSRRYDCQFWFKYETHSTSIVFSAVRSPGAYVFVTAKGDGNSTPRHVYVKSNDGMTPAEDNIIRNDDENYRLMLLGRSNETGLIVGCTNFNGMVAYDRSCPNCERLQALEWTGNRQQVHCDGCGRTYMLDTGGIIAGDAGDALLRYNCQFGGAWLTVTN